MSKIIGNTTATPVAIPDWEQTNPRMADYIKNKPDFDGLSDQVENIGKQVGDISLAIDNIDFPVDSVNGQTGTVTLSASDVGARPNTWMPTASDVGAAPAGYGLGGYGKYIDASVRLDDMRSFGAYYWTSSLPINAPADYCTMLVVPMPDHIFQIIMPFGHRGCIITRTMIGSNAIVEWMNPPMELGVEYRTTERWNGEPVYTKVIRFGEMPSNAEGKAVSHGITNLDVVVDQRVIARGDWGTDFGYPNLAFYDNAELTATGFINFTVTSSECIIEANDYTEHAFIADSYIVLKYTKK